MRLHLLPIQPQFFGDLGAGLRFRQRFDLLFL
jgi:hypothetical protein